MALQIVLAFIIDLLTGDPQGFPHPVVIIGRAITALERCLLPLCRNKWHERLAGTFLTVTIVFGTYLVVYMILRSFTMIHPRLGYVVSVWLISSSLAVRSLAAAGMKVLKPLILHDLKSARYNLGMIVGRDTEKLPEDEIIRGAVETIAENIVDGVISPLFYAFLGGAPLALAYKAVNTLDSMVGYKNERYLHFGRASARLDDLANYLPARITGILIVITALLLRKDWRGAWQTILRDARKHPSPNSGIPESGIAGALGIRLGGLNFYQGIPSFRAYLGISRLPLSPNHIKDSINIMYLTSVLGVLIGTAGVVLINCVID